MYTIVIFCLLSASPHLLYGPGNDAISHTEEFGLLADNKTRGMVHSFRFFDRQEPTIDRDSLR